jgi:hypothetical protein
MPSLPPSLVLGVVKVSARLKKMEEHGANALFVSVVLPDAQLYAIISLSKF